jgi:hypothetical protein
MLKMQPRWRDIGLRKEHWLGPKDSLSEKDREENVCVVIWGKNLPDRGNSWAKAHWRLLI